MGKGKLHQILAVEKEAMNQKDQMFEETSKSLKTHSLYNGFRKTLRMFDDSRKQEEAGQEQFSDVTTDVISRLNYLVPFLVNHLDVIHKKEATNGTAKADVVVDGVTLLTNVPATMILRMEREFKEFRKIVKAIPTLQAGVEFVLDVNMDGQIYKTKTPVVSQKIEQIIEHRIVDPATKEHKAQIEKVKVANQVGEYTEIKWSGCLPIKEKADIMNRLEAFIQALKQARAKANDAQIVEVDTTKKVFDWLFEGK